MNKLKMDLHCKVNQKCLKMSVSIYLLWLLKITLFQNGGKMRESDIRWNNVKNLPTFTFQRTLKIDQMWVEMKIKVTKYYFNRKLWKSLNLGNFCYGLRIYSTLISSTIKTLRQQVYNIFKLAFLIIWTHMFFHPNRVIYS